MNTFDVVILGAGPGGYVAAIRASQLGLKTAIIEKEQLGGVCLNWGCIPTKSLLRSAEVYRTVLHAKDFGVTLDHPKPDLQKMVERSRAVASQLSNGIKGLLKKNKVTHIQGHGHFINDT
ncbi:MAG TPA: dihydrolipoyl dehydrogenase, partial [Holosporales bacterium]|nr:dihydrolipoyl dehydrogenase [Holosporales bacterium]